MRWIAMDRIVGRLVGIALLAVVALTGVVVYQFARSQLTASVYRQRLGELSREYEQLRQTYNQAVRRTAVTELRVADGKVSVVIRNVEGVQEVIPTPFDPSREIYVDYVVIGGRLWIRRVFDDRTPPEQGVLIDPKLGAVDWDDPQVGHGKAAYRRLSEGRWIVTVTGDGSLGLAKVEQDAVPELSPPPAVRDYAEIEARIEAELDAVGPGEVVRELVGAE